MWIKTKDNDLINLDLVQAIYYDQDNDETFFVFISSTIAIPGDMREKVNKLVGVM